MSAQTIALEGLRNLATRLSRNEDRDSRLDSRLEIAELASSLDPSWTRQQLRIAFDDALSAPPVAGASTKTKPATGSHLERVVRLASSVDSRLGQELARAAIERAASPEDRRGLYSALAAGVVDQDPDLSVRSIETAMAPPFDRDFLGLLRALRRTRPDEADRLFEKALALAVKEITVDEMRPMPPDWPALGYYVFPDSVAETIRFDPGWSPAAAWPPRRAVGRSSPAPPPAELGRRFLTVAEGVFAAAAGREPATEEEAEAWVHRMFHTANVAEALLPLFERHWPEGASRVRAHIDRIRGTMAAVLPGFEQILQWMAEWKVDPRAMIARVDHPAARVLAVQRAIEDGDAEAAVRVAEETPSIGEDERGRLRSMAASRVADMMLERGDLEKAMAQAQTVPDGSTRVELTVRMARQSFHKGEGDTARRLLVEAERESARLPPTFEGAMALVTTASTVTDMDARAGSAWVDRLVELLNHATLTRASSCAGDSCPTPADLERMATTDVGHYLTMLFQKLGARDLRSAIATAERIRREELTQAALLGACRGALQGPGSFY